MSMGNIEIVVTEETREFAKEVREIIDELERLIDRLENLVMDANDILSKANTVMGEQAPVDTDTHRCKCALIVKQPEQEAE